MSSTARRGLPSVADIPFTAGWPYIMNITMPKFSSYGPVNTKLHYYAPRKELVGGAFTQMLGENPDEGGHYITVRPIFVETEN